jgi:ribonuclease P protein component
MKATKEDLKKLERLLKRSDFLLLNSKGQKWVSKGMIVLACPNDLDKRRVGFTVTKKLEKTAVGRNRIKRRLRATAADILPNFSKPGMDYVLIGRHETATRLYNELQKDLRWCLEKMGHAEAS